MIEIKTDDQIFNKRLEERERLYKEYEREERKKAFFDILFAVGFLGGCIIAAVIYFMLSK